MTVEALSPPYAEPPDGNVRFGGSRSLFRMAAKYFGVKLHHQEDYDWSAVLSAAMLVDDVLDEQTDNDYDKDVVASFSAIMSAQLRPDINRDQQIRAANYYHRLPFETRVRYIGLLRDVGQLSKEQKAAKTVEQLVQIRLKESGILTSLLYLPTEELPDTKARKRFNAWLDGWGNAGYLLDSLFDAKEDYTNGLSGVYPSTSARIALAGAAFRESFAALKKTSPRLLKECAMVGLRYVVQQKRSARIDTSLK